MNKMNNTERVLKEAWSSIDKYGGSLQLPIKHLLNLHARIESSGNKSLVIVSPQPIRNTESSKSIEVKCNVRADGQYYISYELVKPSQDDVFICMCANLIDYSKEATDIAHAIIRIDSRFEEWKRLMERQNSGILSDEKIRGLLGELYYLLRRLESNTPPVKAIAGWVGPEGADQDFVYSGKWHEIKTTKLDSDRVLIHSIEQLGGSNDCGELIVYRIEKCSPETVDCISLPSLIEQVETHIKDVYGLVDQFVEKLNKIGYVDQKAYHMLYYKNYGYDSYMVDEGFPRLTRDSVRHEIIKCEYTISLPSIEAWKE